MWQLKGRLAADPRDGSRRSAVFSNATCSLLQTSCMAGIGRVLLEWMQMAGSRQQSRAYLRRFDWVQQPPLAGMLFPGAISRGWHSAETRRTHGLHPPDHWPCTMPCERTAPNAPRPCTTCLYTTLVPPWLSSCTSRMHHEQFTDTSQMQHPFTQYANAMHGA